MRVSIITAAWNAEKTIADAIESVFAQKLDEGDEIEYIVVDGASNDGTMEVVREWESSYASFRLRQGYGGRDGGFKVERGLSFRWVSEKDKGLYDAINKGIKMATGDIVGIVNADDYLDGTDVIAKIIAAFKADPTLDGTYADVRFVKNGKTTRYCTGKYFKNWMFRFATFPAHPSTYLKRECFAKYGYYSLDYSICADFEMMLRLFVKHQIKTRYLPFCTAAMRVGGVSTKGIRSNIEINRQDLRALKANGIWSATPILYLKYFFKIWGYVFKKRGAKE